MLLGSPGSVRPRRGLGKRFGTPTPPEGLLPVPRGFARDPPGSHTGSFPAGAGQSRGSRRPRQCGGGWCRRRGPQRCVSSAAVGGESKAGPPLRRPAGAAGSSEPSRRTGELPQGHCPAQCSEAAPNSILPSGPCYDELVAPLYSYSIGASSRYNIFYSASFARLHSESPRGTGTQAGQGRWAGGVPGQLLPLAGLSGPVRRCGGAEQAAAAQSGAEPLSCSSPQAPAAGPPTPRTSSPGSRST